MLTELIGSIWAQNDTLNSPLYPDLVKFTNEMLNENKNKQKLSRRYGSGLNALSSVDII